MRCSRCVGSRGRIVSHERIILYVVENNADRLMESFESHLGCCSTQPIHSITECAHRAEQANSRWTSVGFVRYNCDKSVSTAVTCCTCQRRSNRNKRSLHAGLNFVMHVWIWVTCVTRATLDSRSEAEWVCVCVSTARPWLTNLREWLPSTRASESIGNVCYLRSDID
jgi:hypothetical protein